VHISMYSKESKTFVCDYTTVYVLVGASVQTRNKCSKNVGTSNLENTASLISI